MLSPKWILHTRSLSLGGGGAQRLIAWLNVILVVMLAWSLAQFTWRLVPPAEVNGGPLTSLGTPTASSLGGADSRRANLLQVASLHLFGVVDAAPDKEEQAPITAPETRLNLTLKGLVALDAQEEALAIIAPGRGDEQAYRVGDTVPGGAILHEILPDRVILKRGGRFETLTLPKEKTDTGDIPAPAITTNRGIGRPSLQGHPAGNAQQLRMVRDTILHNPQEALQLINAQPVMDGGQLKGYRVNPGRDRRLFNSVGLRPGDIVTSVNGISLSDPTQMGKLFDQLTAARRLDVTVERGGRQSQLSLDLE